MIKLTKQTKDKLIKNAVHFWYIIVIVLFMVATIWLWQARISAKKDLATLQAKVNLTEDIKAIESRLEAMKLREKEYLTLINNQDKLNKTLEALDKRQKELQKLKKGKLENEIKKMDDDTLSATYGAMGFTNTLMDK
jgi:hypothetical protein